jgi:hypothetical protein
MGFILTGAWLFSRTRFFHLFLEEKIVPIKTIVTYRQTLLISMAGLFFSLGILTKVPAILDVAPFFLIGIFTIFDHFSIRRSRKVLFSILSLWEILGISIAACLLLSFVYFALRGSLRSYIDIGILYNFRYAENWALPTLPFGLSFFFTLPGKTILLAFVLLMLTLLSKKLAARTQFVVIWCASALFGALLSSRPYPHYLLQVVAPFSLLAGLYFQKVKSKVEYFFLALPFGILVLAVVLIHFGFYKTSTYYIHFLQYVTRQISQDEYYQDFDGLMTDNYKAAKILAQDPEPRMFIWGTNPTLYALTKKIPVGRFIVAFHIQDFPGAFQETYQDLTAVQPEFIVVMKDEQIKFPQFFTYLHLNYLPVKELDHMVIYKKTNLPTNGL